MGAVADTAVSLFDTPRHLLDADPAEIRPARGPTELRRTPQVVILDANRRQAELWGEIVASNGVRGTHVRSGAATVDLIEAGQHHCVLVGSLTDGSARAFVAWARRNYPTLTLLAAAERVEHVTELYAAGADHVFVPPRDVGLLGPVRRLAAHARLPRAARRPIVAPAGASAPTRPPDPTPIAFSRPRSPQRTW